jgi:Na+/proline symporter
MKPSRFSVPEFLYNLSFLLYLGGSSYAQAQNGIELSLWLMTFAMVISALTTVLPWLGFRWLKLPAQGSRFGKGAALFVQICSWAAFTAAMYSRITRNLPDFHIFITVTTLLWAAWMLLLIYSRHAFHPTTSSDTLSPASQPKRNGEEKVEE